MRTETVKNQFVIDAYLRIVTREKNYRYEVFVMHVVLCFSCEYFFMFFLF